MYKVKLLGLSFAIAFGLTAVLCILFGHPFIFLPADYSFFSFISLGIFIGVFCICLVYFTLSSLKNIRKLTKTGIKEPTYYSIGTLIMLQLITIGLGYMESTYIAKDTDLFYYYTGAGNSLIYIFTGNLTALVVSLLYGRREKRLRESNTVKFDFEN